MVGGAPLDVPPTTHKLQRDAEHQRPSAPATHDVGADRQASAVRLWPAIVLCGAEEACTIFADGRSSVVAYALPFPRPRADRVGLGN